jgi:hypothetical protein
MSIITTLQKVVTRLLYAHGHVLFLETEYNIKEMFIYSRISLSNK